MDADHCRREIADLHAFFEAWFAGRLPDEDAAFARFADAMAADFALVGPDGKRRERAELVASLRAAHGAHAARGLRIETREERARELAPGAFLATYEEWHLALDAPPRGRRSTALLRTTERALEWLHVHETWIT